MKRFAAFIGIAITLLIVWSIFASRRPYIEAGSMVFPRVYHQAILLNNGEVFIVGGTASTGSWSTPIRPISEIYNPTTQNFRQTAKMRLWREHFTATRLQDGRVLITGGQLAEANGKSGLDTKFTNRAEIYDPVTNRFLETGQMTTPRAYHAATLLKDGRVLIFGGKNEIYSEGTYIKTKTTLRFIKNPKPDNTTLKSAELFNPHTGHFTQIASMNQPNGLPGSALLQDGQVLILPGDYRNSLELFVPEAMQFNVLKNNTSHINSSDHYIPLNNTQLLLFGMLGAEIYNFKTGETQPLNLKRVDYPANISDSPVSSRSLKKSIQTKDLTRVGPIFFINVYQPEGLRAAQHHAFVLDLNKHILKHLGFLDFKGSIPRGLSTITPLNNDSIVVIGCPDELSQAQTKCPAKIFNNLGK